MALTESQIQELYVAYFGRPADVEGKAYWSGSNTGISTVLGFAANMHSQSEFQDAYGSKKTATQVNQIYQNLFSRDADADGLEYWTGQIANGSLQLAEIAVHLIWAAKNNDGGSADKTALENKVAAETAFTTDVAADATAQLAYTADDADAFGTAKTFISGVTTTAATATEIDTQITTITTAYTANEAKGVSYTLTTASDDLTGGTKNDTFSAVIDANTATENTFNTGDVIDGGSGTDTLKLTYAVDGAANTAANFPGATISNVENFEIKNTEANDATINFANIAGETSVNNNLSLGGVVLNNLAAGTDADITGNGSLTNGASTFDYVDAATSADLDIIGGVTAGAVTVSGGSKLKTVDISSSGAANTIGDLTIDTSFTSFTIDAATKLTTAQIHSSAATKLTIKGAGAVDINSNALETTVVTVDGSTSTGDIDVKLGAVGDATDPSTVDIVDVTVTTGSGNDDVDMDSVVTGREMLVNTGAGNDVVSIGTALVNSSSTLAGDVIDGGEGTDTLRGLSATLGAHAKTTGVSNFETIAITDTHDTSLDVADFGTGITTVQLEVGGSTSGTIVFGEGSTSTVEYASVTVGAITITDGSSTATTDAATFTITDTDNVDVFAGQAITSTGIETLTINTSNTKTTATAAVEMDFGAIGITADTGGTAKLVITGSNKFDADGQITAQVVDASALTGILDMTGNALSGIDHATKVNTITGGSANDILIGDADDVTNMDGGAGNDNITGGTAAETISGGTGNDVIAGGGGKDTLNGGAGNDTITAGGTTASIDGGAGNDTFTMAGNLTYGTTIVGGEGTDTLSITGVVSAANGSVVSGVENLDAAYGAADVATDLDNFANNTFTKLTFDNQNLGNITSIRNETIEYTAATGGATIGGKEVGHSLVLEDATGSADSISLEFSGNDAVNQANEITIAGVETINILTSDDDSADYEVKTVDTLIAAAADKIVVTGDSSITLSGSTTATLNEIDASGMTIGNVATVSTIVGLTYATGTTGNTTVGDSLKITGSNGQDTLTGHANTDDTFLGGLGVDTLVYLGRVGTFTGGAGNDVFDMDALGTTTGSKYLTITDLAVGDQIAFDDIDAGTDRSGAIANQTLGAKHTLGASATFTDYLDSATATGAQAATEIDWFQFGGNTYITIDNSNETTFVAGQDGIVKITGEIDLKSSTTTSAYLSVVAV